MLACEQQAVQACGQPSVQISQGGGDHAQPQKDGQPSRKNCCVVQCNEDVQRVKLGAVVGVTVYCGAKESMKNFADGEKISVAYTVSEHFQFWPAEPLRLTPRGGPLTTGRWRRF